jgi:predicted MFS family arabinose efflux permease
MDNRGYSFNDQSYVMMTHFMSMFSPGFFTGSFIAKRGAFPVATVGTIIFAASSVVFLIGEELWNFFLGMSLLGIAWNLSFSAGTVMLTSCYNQEEATDIQAVNDFILFTVAGCGSLLSGIIYSLYDWFAVIYMVSIMMFLNTIFFIVAHFGNKSAGGEESRDSVDILDKLLSGDADLDNARAFERVRSLSVA